MKRICNNEHEDGAYPAVCNTQNRATELILLPGINAFIRLKELKLAISCGYSGVDGYKTLIGLRHLLHYVRDLEMLDLKFGTHTFGRVCGIDRDSWFQYGSVFPRDGRWPHLRRLVVQNLEITDEDLVHLLFVKMLSLQDLEFGDMCLLRGTWERIIETLRFRGLSSFKMSSYNLIYDVEECFLAPIMYLDPEDDEADIDNSACQDFIERIERYVVHWRHDFTLRHPSLKTDQPTQDSLDFLELDDFFGRYQKIRGIGGTLPVDAAWLKTEVAKVCAEANRKREGKRLFHSVSTATADSLSCKQRRIARHPKSVVEKATMDK